MKRFLALVLLLNMFIPSQAVVFYNYEDYLEKSIQEDPAGTGDDEKTNINFSDSESDAEDEQLSNSIPQNNTDSDTAHNNAYLLMFKVCCFVAGITGLSGIKIPNRTNHQENLDPHTALVPSTSTFNSLTKPLTPAEVVQEVQTGPRINGRLWGMCCALVACYATGDFLRRQLLKIIK